MRKPKTIFISYSWDDSIIVDHIEEYMTSVGIKIVRDKKDLKFLDNIKEFMTSIRTYDFVLMIVSDSYLKSRNCMFEALEVLKDPKIKEKLIPIIHNSTKVYDPFEWPAIIKFWEEKSKELEINLKEIDLNNTDQIDEEMQILSKISANIGELLKTIQSMNCPPYKMHVENEFKDVLLAIKFSISDNPVLIEDVMKILNFENGFEIKNKHFTTECPTCGIKQTLDECKVYKTELETVYECKKGCQPIVIIGLPGTKSWIGRGYRIGKYVIRNAKDISMCCSKSGKIIVFNARPNALAKFR